MALHVWAIPFRGGIMDIAIYTHGLYIQLSLEFHDFSTIFRPWQQFSHRYPPNQIEHLELTGTFPSSALISSFFLLQIPLFFWVLDEILWPSWPEREILFSTAQWTPSKERGPLPPTVQCNNIQQGACSALVMNLCLVHLATCYLFCRLEITKPYYHPPSWGPEITMNNAPSSITAA